MYGSNKSINIKIPFPEKLLTLRLPTNDEVTAYLDAFAKKGRKEDDLTADSELFTKIRLDQDGPELDQYEQSYVINNVLNHRVMSCDKTGDEYQVRLKTPFGEVTHVLVPPTLKQLTQYRGGLVSGDSKSSRSAAVRLYDTLQSHTEGYGEGVDVPILHKVAVVGEIYLAHSQIDPIQVDPNG